MIWKRFQAGGYVRGRVPDQTGRRVRLGAYGDPAAIPVAVIVDLAAQADEHIGFTQRWRQGQAEPGLHR